MEKRLTARNKGIMLESYVYSSSVEFVFLLQKYLELDILSTLSLLLL